MVGAAETCCAHRTRPNQLLDALGVCADLAHEVLHKSAARVEQLVAGLWVDSAPPCLPPASSTPIAY